LGWGKCGHDRGEPTHDRQPVGAEQGCVEITDHVFTKARQGFGTLVKRSRYRLGPSFCREIAEEMVRTFGISHAEAVARVNRQWSEPGPSGRFPRTWIVGLNLAYHQTPDDWAGDIYYGKDSHWWRPESDPRPLPPP
jgi:hypothetical protein